MISLPPAQELRDILGDGGFLRLHGQDHTTFVSDAPRWVSMETLEHMRRMMRERGFTVQTAPANLLFIDLQPVRWKALLDSFPRAEAAPLPADDRLHGVYALARLLALHPSDFERQPMEMIRAVMKQYGRKDGLCLIAPKALAQCSGKLRRGEPLPSALANVLFTWLKEQTEEART